jgi:hypothetical protein
MVENLVWEISERLMEWKEGKEVVDVMSLYPVVMEEKPDGN